MAIRDDVLAMPEHLGDALWRVDSARLAAAESTGLLVCGMGGSAIGGDLAAAALGERLQGPLLTVRGYELPSWAGAEWTVLCSSYSGETEETLSCFEAAGAIGASRIAVSTGGALVDRARESGVPVIGLPGVLQPRAAVAYMFVAAAEAAALSGATPRIGGEIEAAAGFLRGELGALQERAATLAAALGPESMPVACGAGLTAPVARRWKTQLNENAKLQAFFSELPEADHNEICGWGGLPEGARPVVVLIEDPDQGLRMKRRFELTAAAIAADGVHVVRVEADGDTRTARVFWAVILGDLVSLELAAARGADPLAVAAIDSLKSELARS
jgi:glucose/mannose-6-phosphate isomerase